MTQEDLDKLAEGDANFNQLVDERYAQYSMERTVGINSYKAGFKKALELVFKHIEDNKFTMPYYDFDAVAIYHIKDDFELE